MRESLQLLFDFLCLKFEIGIKRTGIVQLKRGRWSATGPVLSSVFLHFAACEGRGIAWLAESEGKENSVCSISGKRFVFFVC
jgi:hypothetical protein